MHFLMSALGSAGDVHPFIALGQALQRRGHEVELLASPWFQARIEAAGLGIAYRAKPVVAAQAHARIDHSDLTALLYFQGYPCADFSR